MTIKEKKELYDVMFLICPIIYILMVSISLIMSVGPLEISLGLVVKSKMKCP